MKIAVLGLGIIGSAWAKNLIADGRTVRCWNRTPKKFPNFYSSISEAVDQADAIFIIVADPPAVQSVSLVTKLRLRSRNEEGSSASQAGVSAGMSRVEFYRRYADEITAHNQAPFTTGAL